MRNFGIWAPFKPLVDILPKCLGPPYQLKEKTASKFELRKYSVYLPNMRKTAYKSDS